MNINEKGAVKNSKFFNFTMSPMWGCDCKF